MIWLLTCEHYGNRVPFEFQYLFSKAHEVLESHRGYDLNIAPVFHAIQPQFDAAFYYQVTRLLIEPNRSLHHRHLFSPFSMHLPKEERVRLISEFYHPYRKEVESFIADNIDEQVIHISLHSFTPKLGHQIRNAQVGLLYDPKRKGERQLSVMIKQFLNENSDFKARYNYPYRGVTDGFTTYLRKCFPQGYSGIELELRNDVTHSLSLLMLNCIRQLRADLD